MTEADPRRHSHLPGSRKYCCHRQRGTRGRASEEGVLTPPRELKVGDRVQSHSARQRGRLYVVLELGAIKGRVFRGSAPHPADTPGTRLGSLDEPRDYIELPIDRIHMDGKARRRGWSLVIGQESRPLAPGMKLQKDPTR